MLNRSNSPETDHIDQKQYDPAVELKLSRVLSSFGTDVSCHELFYTCLVKHVYYQKALGYVKS